MTARDCHKRLITDIFGDQCQAAKPGYQTEAGSDLLLIVGELTWHIM